MSEWLVSWVYHKDRAGGTTGIHNSPVTEDPMRSFLLRPCRYEEFNSSINIDNGIRIVAKGEILLFLVVLVIYQEL